MFLCNEQWQDLVKKHHHLWLQYPSLSINYIYHYVSPSIIVHHCIHHYTYHCQSLYIYYTYIYIHTLYIHIVCMYIYMYIHPSWHPHHWITHPPGEHPRALDRCTVVLPRPGDGWYAPPSSGSPAGAKGPGLSMDAMDWFWDNLWIIYG